MKINKWTELVYAFCVLVFIFVIIIISYSLFDLFGNSKGDNQVVIFGGFLGFLGGVTGAFSAYIIARIQMTKQIDLQFKKDKEKIKLEMILNQYTKAINQLLECEKNVLDFQRQLSEIPLLQKKELYEDEYRMILNNTFNQIQSCLMQYHQYTFLNEKEDFIIVFQNKMKDIHQVTLDVIFIESIDFKAVNDELTKLHQLIINKTFTLEKNKGDLFKGEFIF